MNGGPSWRRGLAAAVVVTGLVVGAVACGGGNTQGRKGTDLDTVKNQVSQLRLEVESLRQEVAQLRDAASTTTTTAGDTSSSTSTTTVGRTTSTSTSTSTR